jgi:hypothetical protein
MEQLHLLASYSLLSSVSKLKRPLLGALAAETAVTVLQIELDIVRRQGEDFDSSLCDQHSVLKLRR